MNKVTKISLLLFFSICMLGMVTAQKASSKKMSCEIVARNSSHIARITSDTIVVVAGSTYSFTVDTHPDSGWYLQQQM